jgi:hypothetical protein
MTNFWAKSTIILSVLAKKNFLYLLKNKINYNFMIFKVEKMVEHKISFSSPLLVLWLDPGWIKIRFIRDKHPGSATLGMRNKILQ